MWYYATWDVASGPVHLHGSITSGKTDREIAISTTTVADIAPARLYGCPAARSWLPHGPILASHVWPAIGLASMARNWPRMYGPLLALHEWPAIGPHKWPAIGLLRLYRCPLASHGPLLACYGFIDVRWHLMARYWPFTALSMSAGIS